MPGIDIMLRPGWLAKMFMKALQLRPFAEAETSLIAYTK
jgi:hypothetical protein